MDVYYFPNSMIDSTIVLTNPTVSTAIQSLPEPFIRVLHNTTLFRFVKRPSNNNNTNNQNNSDSSCSAEAQLYFTLLEEKKPTLLDLLRRNPSSRVCFKCTFCHRATSQQQQQYVVVPGSVSFAPLTVDGIISALKQRTKHLSECHSINMEFNFNDHYHTLTVFLKEWINVMTMKQNQTDTMMIQSQRQQQQQQQQLLYNYPQSFPVQHPNQYFYPMTILQQQQQQQQQQAVELGLLQSQQMNKFQQQQRSLEFLVRELDDLHWSILGYYTDHDEDDDDNDDHRNESSINNKSNVKILPPKDRPTATKLIPDLYVPLDSRQIARCRDQKLIFRDVTSEETKREKPKALDITTATASSGASVDDIPCKTRLHGKIGPRDVVIPTKNCTRDVTEVVHDLVGNLRFMQLVVDHRLQYAVLTKEEEQIKLAKELLTPFR